MQSKIISLLTLSLALAVGATFAHAEELSKSGKPLTAQQSKMKACNADAKSQSLKGDERKAFMSSCLKGGATRVAPTTESAESTAAADAAQAAQAAPKIAKAETPRQAQRKACGVEAKSQSLKGDDRKEFVKECMKRPTPAAAL